MTIKKARERERKKERERERKKKEKMNLNLRSIVPLNDSKGDIFITKTLCFLKCIYYCKTNKYRLSASAHILTILAYTFT